MADRWTEGWVDEIFVNGHRLVTSTFADVTLDDPATDRDSTVGHDRARIYQVQCRTCGVVVTPDNLVYEAAHFAVNTRTGEWLVSHRTDIDDPAWDTVQILVEHCRRTFICHLNRTEDHRPDLGDDPQKVTYGFGDPIDLDQEALAAARLMTGLGESPWNAIEVYASAIHIH